MARPFPIILCGKTAIMFQLVRKHLEPEYEVIHFIPSLAAAHAHLPALLRGLPLPSDPTGYEETGGREAGTGNRAAGRPRAVVLGGGYSNDEIFPQVRAAARAAPPPATGPPPSRSEPPSGLPWSPAVSAGNGEAQQQQQPQQPQQQPQLYQQQPQPFQNAPQPNQQAQSYPNSSQPNQQAQPNNLSYPSPPSTDAGVTAANTSATAPATAATAGPDAEPPAVPWLREDLRHVVLPSSPHDAGYAAGVAGRAKACLDRLREEGRLDEDGVYLY